MLLKSLLIAVSLFLYSFAIAAETVWIDVRSIEENKANNIEGDLRVTYSDILAEVAMLYPDKETDIHLYCRTGRRAGIAQSILAESGYINVSNVGSIEIARKERGL